MKKQSYFVLITLLLSHSSVFSLNDGEIDEPSILPSPLNTTKILTKTWEDDLVKFPQQGLKIESKACKPPADTSSNIIVENGILKEKKENQWTKYWIDESK